MRKEEIVELYKRLRELIALDEEGNVYGGSATIDADWYVLDDFLEGLSQIYEEDSDWYNAYYQVYMWEYQAFYEGLHTYYGNLYGTTDYKSILKAAKYLTENGYDVIAACYNDTMFDTRQFPENEKWPPEWTSDIYEKINLAKKWIEDHQIEIRDFFFDILLKHEEELLKMCE